MVHVVAAAIVRDGRLLTARRPLHTRNGGKWELPGGKVEPGESEEAALIREIQEELGCAITPVERLGEVLYDGLCLCGWRCVLVEGEPVISEHTDMRWLEPSQLYDVDWATADVPLLETIFGPAG